jgi:hypothetical protein
VQYGGDPGGVTIMSMQLDSAMRLLIKVAKQLVSFRQASTTLLQSPITLGKATNKDNKQTVAQRSIVL